MSALQRMLCLLALLCGLWPGNAHAAEQERKTLAERIPAVSGRFFQKVGRVEVAPTLGLTLNDPFFDGMPIGGRVAYHIFEEFAVGVSGEYYLNFASPVLVTGGGNVADVDFNRTSFAARLDLMWAPIYGKLSLMAETVVRFDTYLSFSAGVVGPTDTAPEFAFGGALGQHYFINRFMAFTTELRAQMFRMARSPAIDSTRSFQSLLSVNVGLSFFLPSEVERESVR